MIELRRSMGDLIVVGAGAAGLSAAWAASLMGFSVTCLEARRVGHPAASSAGLAKILRYAYDDGRFSRLLLDAERRWRDLEKRSGYRLLSRCDNLNIGTASSPAIGSIISSLDAVGRKHEVLRPGSRRLAELGVRLFPGEEAVLEIDAGVIRPVRALAALSQEACRSGVRIVEGVQANTITEYSGGILVETDRKPLHADRVIIAAGPWLPDLVPAVPVTITRQQQAILTTDRPVGDGRCVAWAEITDDDGYGIMNAFDGRHVMGSHAPGRPVATPHWPQQLGDPNGDNLGTQIAAFCARLAHRVRIDHKEMRHCHYTMTADNNFLVTSATDLEGVILLSACSGHGFKFVLATGHQAAQLAAA